ncbi:MAG: ATP-binding protein, partial [Thermoplasmata archaeon]|nr:ATP-binding protein [Thermoplasmata archaeon]
MGKGKTNPFSLSNRILLHIDSYNINLEDLELRIPPKELTQKYIALEIGGKFNQVRARLKELERDGYIVRRVCKVRGVLRRVPVYLLTETGKEKAEEIKKQINKMRIIVRDEHGKLYEERIGDLKERFFPFPKYNELYLIMKNKGVLDLHQIKEYGKAGVKVTFISDSPVVSHFYGRERERIRLMEELKKPGPRVYVIKGMAGIGKSYLAKVVIDYFIHDYHIFWYTVREGDTPNSLLRELSKFLKRCDITSLSNLLRREQPWTLNDVKDALEKDLYEFPGIIIIDDVHNASSSLLSVITILKESVLKSKGNKALFLTRYEMGFYEKREVDEGIVEEMVLRYLEFHAAKEILAAKGIPEREQWRIYNILGGHPQVLELVRPETATFENPPASVSEFIEKEVLGKLSPLEKEAVYFGTIFRNPMPFQIFLQHPKIDLRVIDILVDKSILTRTTDGNYFISEMLKEIIKSRLPKEKFFYYYDLAIDYYRKQKEPKARVEEIYYLLKREKYNEAFKVILENYDSIITLGYMQELKEFLSTVESHLSEIEDPTAYKVIVAKVLFKENNVKECMKLLDEIEVEKIEKSDLKVVYHIIKGAFYYHRGEWERSLEHYNEAWRISSRETLLYLSLEAMEGIAKVHLKKGDILLAEEIIEEAKRLSEKVNSNTIKGKILLTYALVLENGIKGPQASVEYIEEAIKCFREDENIYDLTRAFNNLGVAQFKLGNLNG